MKHGDFEHIKKAITRDFVPAIGATLDCLTHCYTAEKDVTKKIHGLPKWFKRFKEGPEALAVLIAPRIVLAGFDIIHDVG
jgi:hypothetical protein